MAQEINGNWQILDLINALTSSIAGTIHPCHEWDDANYKVWLKIVFWNSCFDHVRKDTCTEAKMALGND